MRASGGPPEIDLLPADASQPFDVVRVSAGVYAFLGGRSGNIMMSVTPDGQATFRQQGTLARHTLQLDREHSVELRLLGFEHLVVAARELQGWAVAFTGPGRVNITGVRITQACVEGSTVHAANAMPDIAGAMRPVSDRASLHVNGSLADFIKTSWVWLERENGAERGAKNRDYWRVIAGVELALMYVGYLKGGGKSFDQFVAGIHIDDTGRPVRRQSLHDNLLGMLNASMLRAGFIENLRAVPRELSLTREGLYQVYAGLAGEFAARPYCDGRDSAEHDADCASIAFDFAEGWTRSDYVRRWYEGRLAPVAVKEGASMWGGSRGGVTGFNIARHEGAGIELALKVRNDHGGDCEALPHEQGPALYRADAGEGRPDPPWGISAKWFVDFSVSTYLKGVERLLDDFRFVLSVDTDPAEDHSCFCRFMLTRPGSLYLPALGEIDVGRAWLLVGEGDGIVLRDDGMLFGGYGDDLDESVGGFVSQHAVNFGVNFMRRLLGDYANRDGPRLFGPGVFDIRLEAFDDGGALLVDNHVRVRVN